MIKRRKPYNRFDHPEYRIWEKMKRRCNDPNLSAYKYYGAKGIKVCDEWMADFEAFYLHVGPRPSASYWIDRIDNSKGYEPGNVKWSTVKEQQNNRSMCVRIKYQGRTQTLQQWADEKGFSRGMISSRLRSGWSIEEAMTTPRQGQLTN